MYCTGPALRWFFEFPGPGHFHRSVEFSKLVELIVCCVDRVKSSRSARAVSLAHAQILWRIGWQRGPYLNFLIFPIITISPWSVDRFPSSRIDGILRRRGWSHAFILADALHTEVPYARTFSFVNTSFDYQVTVVHLAVIKSRTDSALRRLWFRMRSGWQMHSPSKVIGWFFLPLRVLIIWCLMSQLSRIWLHCLASPAVAGGLVCPFGPRGSDIVHLRAWRLLLTAWLSPHRRTLAIFGPFRWHRWYYTIVLHGYADYAKLWRKFCGSLLPFIRSAKWLSDPRCATSILLVVSMKSPFCDDFGNWDCSRVSRYTNALFLQLIGIPSFDVIQSTGLQSCARGFRL
jgi:hypothetical protein